MLKQLIFFLMLSLATTLHAQPFISVKGTQLMKGEQAYYFTGTNLWYGINLASKGRGGDRPRLLRELDQLKSMGITNVRLMASSEGPDETATGRMFPAMQNAPGIYNNELLEALDFILVELAKREMYAVLCLNNFWPWSGGMAQYYAWSKKKSIPYPPVTGNNEWSTYMEFTSKFYSNWKAKRYFRKHLKVIINRTNSISGKAYKDDPTIMAWELCNEPRGMDKPQAYRRWIRKTAGLIKKWDSKHLITIGSEGNTAAPNGNLFDKDHKFKNIDYTTIHIWAQNWDWFDPSAPDSTFDSAIVQVKQYLQAHIDLAKQLGKPIVLEEFGIARDQDNHDPNAATYWRDQYYDIVFELIYQSSKSGSPMAGSNFWAWSGEGRPAMPKAIWQKGDDLTGDPPHEYQGWYSIYNKDDTTIQIIKRYAELMNQL